MKRILILGCNEITKRLVLALCADRSLASGIALASENREDCDDLKNLAMRRGFRVTTSAFILFYKSRKIKRKFVEFINYLLSSISTICCIVLKEIGFTNLLYFELTKLQYF